jgi:ABC-2 type transport system ATP-binding protein
VAIQQVLQLIIKQAAGDGTTVLFSSHQLADVEQIADHVAIIDGGRVVVDGALDDLRAAYRRIQLVFEGAAPDAAFESKGVVSLRREGRVLSVLCRGAEASVVMEARTLNPKGIEVLPVTLREIFLETVGMEN